jgi:3-oxoadipate enol-lactonase
MPLISIGKQKLFYLSKGEGYPVILLHDLFEDHLHWSVIQDALSEHFQVISVDLRGSGESSISSKHFTIEECAEDIIALVDHLKLKKFHLVGDSFGGAIAQTLAHKYPERIDRLVLANSFLHLSKASAWFLDMAADLFKEDGSYVQVYKLILPWFFSTWFLGFEEDVAKALKAIEKRKHPLTPKAYEYQLEALKQFDSTKWVKKIQALTLFVIGEEDVFTLFKESRSLLTKIINHQVELCPGGHKSKLECPTRFSEVVTKFLLQEGPQEKSSSTK